MTLVGHVCVLVGHVCDFGGSRVCFSGSRVCFSGSRVCRLFSLRYQICHTVLYQDPLQIKYFWREEKFIKSYTNFENVSSLSGERGTRKSLHHVFVICDF